jgi:signal recognition particle receptor subunit beta
MQTPATRTRPLELRILGPQFSDPGIYIAWLGRRHACELRAVKLQHADYAIETTFSTAAGEQVHVLASRAPYWDREKAYELMLRDADAAIVMLNGTAELVRLNAPELDAMHAARGDRLKALPVVVAVNNPYCDDSRPQADVATASAALRHPWRVYSTRIGSFKEDLTCDDGAAELLDAILAMSR